MAEHVGFSQTKVLQVFASLDMGGAESRMMDVFRHVDHEKYAFEFLTMGDMPQYYEGEIRSLGGKVHRVCVPTGKNVLTHTSQLIQAIQDGCYDAVHAHTLYHAGLVMFAAWKAGVPIRIAHARNTQPQNTSTIRNAMSAIGKSLIRLFATHRLAISTDAGDYLFGRSQYEVLPNAIDLARYKQITVGEVKSLREQIGADGGDFIIGQISSFVNQKNHSFTMEWFANYAHDNPDATLVLVGDGELRTNVEELAADLGIRERVIFTGVRGDVPQLLHAMNVTILPSKFEGLGGVVLESQAANVPAVISSVIPKEADLNIGLVTRCDITSGFTEWDNAINAARHWKPLPYEQIRCAFDAAGYSLQAEVSRLEKLYATGE